MTRICQPPAAYEQGHCALNRWSVFGLNFSSVSAVYTPLMNRRQALRLRDFYFLGIVISLQAEPETGAGPEEPRQPDRCVSGDGPLAITYGRDSWLRNSDFLCQPILTDSHRNQEFLPKNFAGMAGQSRPHYLNKIKVYIPPCNHLRVSLQSYQ